MRVSGIGEYELLGETLDDAAGEAFDKSAKLLGLPYPGGVEISKLAEQGTSGIFQLPRPMLHSKDLNFSFSGLKTAVLTTVGKQPRPLSEGTRADIARGFVDAIVEVLVAKCAKALRQTHSRQLVVAGGVSANKQLREGLAQMTARRRCKVFFPPLEFCTDNGAMIAFAGAMHLKADPACVHHAYGFTVRPRWPLEELVEA